jgi:hypothetical protein
MPYAVNRNNDRVNRAMRNQTGRTEGATPMTKRKQFADMQAELEAGIKADMAQFERGELSEKEFGELLEAFYRASYELTKADPSQRELLLLIEACRNTEAGTVH